MRKSGTQAATETGNGGVLFTGLLLQTFSAYSPTQGGTTHSGLGSPIPVISKKMSPACLQASLVEADVLFCFFSTEISFFQKVLPKKVASTVLNSWWEHKGRATWSKSNSIQLCVCEHSPCPNNVTRGYLSKRNQSPFKTCMQMRSVSILLAKTVSKTNIHEGGNQKQNKNKLKSLTAREQGSEIKDKRQEEAPYSYCLSSRTQYGERSWTEVGKGDHSLGREGTWSP